MDICFEGIGQVVATFLTEDKTLAAGMAVTLTDNGEVGLGEDGKPLCGVTAGAERGGAVAVQIGGVARVGCPADDKLEVGWQELVCDGKGGVKTAEDTNGVKCLVLAVDKNEQTVVIRL